MLVRRSASTCKICWSRKSPNGWGERRASARINPLEQPGYRNGYGKTRRFTLSLGTIEIRRPRVRDLGERFVSKVLPLFQAADQAGARI